MRNYYSLLILLLRLHLPLAIFWTSTSPMPSPNPSTSPPINSITTCDARRAAAPSTLGFSGAVIPLAWRPFTSVLAHTAWRWYSHTVQRYIRPALFNFLHSPQVMSPAVFDVGSSFKGCGWIGKLIWVERRAQQGCIWKLHALHL